MPRCQSPAHPILPLDECENIFHNTHTYRHHPRGAPTKAPLSTRRTRVPLLAPLPIRDCRAGRAGPAHESGALPFSSAPAARRWHYPDRSEVRITPGLRAGKPTSGTTSTPFGITPQEVSPMSPISPNPASPNPTSAPAGDNIPAAPHDAAPLRERAWSLFCHGHRSPAIAPSLGVPERTIRGWLTAIQSELAADTRDNHHEAVRLAVARQLAIAASAWASYERVAAYERRLLDPHHPLTTN